MIFSLQQKKISFSKNRKTLANPCKRKVFEDRNIYVLDESNKKVTDLFVKLELGCAFQGQVYHTPKKFDLVKSNYDQSIEIKLKRGLMNGIQIYVFNKDRKSLYLKSFLNSFQQPSINLCLKRNNQYELYLIPVSNRQSGNLNDLELEYKNVPISQNCLNDKNIFSAEY